MQVLVVGAGVIGLSIARAMAIAGHDVIVAEAAASIGTGISSRNSEVIHAGLYYPTGSLRALHCPRARRTLYDFCVAHGVPHRKCGKLVVATGDHELASLEAVYNQARINEIEGVEIIDGMAARRLEPELFCVAAMCSPETGIIDSHRFMLALLGDLEDRGGVVAFNTRIERLRQISGGWEVRLRRRRAAVRDGRCSDQLRGTRSATAGASDRRLSRRTRATAGPGQRQLLQLCRAGRRFRG